MKKKIGGKKRITFKQYTTMRFDKVTRPIDEQIVGKLMMKGTSINTIEGQVILTLVN